MAELINLLYIVYFIDEDDILVPISASISRPNDAIYCDSDYVIEQCEFDNIADNIFIIFDGSQICDILADWEDYSKYPDSAVFPITIDHGNMFKPHRQSVC